MSSFCVSIYINKSISYRWAKCIRECYCSYYSKKKPVQQPFYPIFYFPPLAIPQSSLANFPEPESLAIRGANGFPRTGFASPALDFLRAPASPAPARVRPLVVLLFFFPSHAASSRHLCVPLCTTRIPSRSSESCRGTMSQEQSEADLMSASHGHGDPNSSELHSFPIFSAASGWEQQQFPSLPWLQSAGVPGLRRGVLPPNAAPAASAPLSGMYSGEIQIARCNFFVF